MNIRRQQFFVKFEGGKIIPYDKTGYAVWLDLLEGKNGTITIEKEVSKRTGQQNKALHKFFELIASECEENGVTVSVIINSLQKKGVDITPTPEFIKEVWRVIQIAILKKHSTTQLEKDKEIDLVYEAFCKFIGENWGIYVEFPHEKDPRYE